MSVNESIVECQKLACDLKRADVALNYWGSIPKQTRLVEDDKPGDCFRCCIAAVLRQPAEKVPHFLEIAKRENHDMHCLAQHWLNAQGYCLMQSVRMDFPRYWGKGFDGLPVISTGPTERSRGLGKHHAIVTLNNVMVFDPHPSNAGLTAVTQEYVVVPLWEPVKELKPL